MAALVGLLLLSAVALSGTVGASAGPPRLVLSTSPDPPPGRGSFDVVAVSTSALSPAEAAAAHVVLNFCVGNESAIVSCYPPASMTIASSGARWGARAPDRFDPGETLALNATGKLANGTAFDGPPTSKYFFVTVGPAPSSSSPALSASSAIATLALLGAASAWGHRRRRA